MTIKSFASKKIKKFFETGQRGKISPQHARKLSHILDHIDAANDLIDVNFPGSNFHKLKGKLKDFYSIHVSGNWVVIFRFKNGNAYDIDYLDYH
ncbi:MAG: Endoribonuclease HigB [Candidatus Anoxychlamydiales bacterium]|nr:Endoribonuclease HigB [Candidatus Anoxychlamydiales bacterium]NGX35605.1 Endoribonuclease HigB [Candidatus Anoxychlamydiales bacterium]